MEKVFVQADSGHCTFVRHVNAPYFRKNFDCGYLGMHALFSALSEHGQGELAWHMITKREYPSYGNLPERGRDQERVTIVWRDGTPCR